MQNQNTAREQHSEFTCHRNNKEIYKAKGLKSPTKTENIRNKISRDQYQGHICIIHHYQKSTHQYLICLSANFLSKSQNIYFLHACLLAQSLQSLRTRIVKLSSLSDLQCARSQDQDFLQFLSHDAL